MVTTVGRRPRCPASTAWSLFLISSGWSRWPAHLKLASFHLARLLFCNRFQTRPICRLTKCHRCWASCNRPFSFNVAWGTFSCAVKTFWRVAKTLGDSRMALGPILRGAHDVCRPAPISWHWFCLPCRHSFVTTAAVRPVASPGPAWGPTFTVTRDSAVTALLAPPEGHRLAP